jgi:molybdopterin molybdotransferase
MRTVEEHQRIVAELISARPGILAELGDAQGRVLSEDVTATVSLPLFDNSAMDGYAVHAAEVVAAKLNDPVE